MEHPLSQFRFCPKCGSSRFVEHNQKSKHCEACGFTYYFNPGAATVAVIVRGEWREDGGEWIVDGGERNVLENQEAKQSSIHYPLSTIHPSPLSLLVVRRAKEPAKGTLDLPGGFSDMFETSEEGVRREVKEETGLDVTDTKFLFSLPNQYLYSGFLVHTIDMFYLCRVDETQQVKAMDDAEEAMWIPLQDLRPEQFGLTSIRKGVERFLANFPIYIMYK